VNVYHPPTTGLFGQDKCAARYRIFAAQVKRNHGESFETSNGDILRVHLEGRPLTRCRPTRKERTEERFNRGTPFDSLSWTGFIKEHGYLIVESSCKSLPIPSVENPEVALEDVTNVLRTIQRAHDRSLTYPFLRSNAVRYASEKGYNKYHDPTHPHSALQFAQR